jgi:uncharacterized membrane-anchored protein
MKISYKGLIVALLHVAIVLSLGGKLLYDRATRPRVWVKTVSIDPDLPVRGRYLTLNLQAHAPWLKSGKDVYYQPVQLAMVNGELVASQSDANTGMSVSFFRSMRQLPDDLVAINPPVAFFLPEHANAPSARRGEELWAEVTIPKKGPPRPIQLALKDSSGWHPLNVR